MRRPHNSRKRVKIKEDHLPIEGKEQPKPLFLVMQKVWFDEIECGNKDIEYRDDSAFYISRLCTKDKEGSITGLKNYKSVILQEGYHPGSRRMMVEIVDIKYFKRDGFEIYLGKILSRENFDRTNAPKRAVSEKPKQTSPKKKKVVKTQLEKAKMRKGSVLKNFKKEMPNSKKEKPEIVIIDGIEVEIKEHNEPKESFESPYTRFSYLIAGSRKPQDEEEIEFLKNVEEMKKKGIVIDVNRQQKVDTIY